MTVPITKETNYCCYVLAESKCILWNASSLKWAINKLKTKLKLMFNYILYDISCESFLRNSFVTIKHSIIIKEVIMSIKKVFTN